jgi:hypothetical protein
VVLGILLEDSVLEVEEFVFERLPDALGGGRIFPIH